MKKAILIALMLCNQSIHSMGRERVDRLLDNTLCKCCIGLTLGFLIVTNNYVSPLPECELQKQPLPKSMVMSLEQCDNLMRGRQQDFTDFWRIHAQQLRRRDSGYRLDEMNAIEARNQQRSVCKKSKKQKQD